MKRIQKYARGLAQQSGRSCRLAVAQPLHVALGHAALATGSLVLAASANAAPAVPTNIQPQAGAYLANQYFASTLFNSTLQDRGGQSRFSLGDNDYKNPSSAWARIVGGEFDSHAVNNQIATDTDTALVQMGLDLLDNEVAGGRVITGLMAGFGRAKSNSKAWRAADSVDAETSGYSVGVYATWLGEGQSEARRHGPYIDTSLQYAWFDNRVSSSLQHDEKYRSDNWTASLEAGYDLPLVFNQDDAFFLKPQAQFSYSTFGQSDHIDQFGRRIASSELNGWQSRLGLRLYGTFRDNAGTRTQPFVEANWHHASHVGAIAFDGNLLQNDAPASRYELKFGLERQQNRDWNWWFNLGVQVGDAGYESVQAMFGSRNLW